MSGGVISGNVSGESSLKGDSGRTSSEGQTNNQVNTTSQKYFDFGGLKVVVKDKLQSKGKQSLNSSYMKTSSIKSSHHTQSSEITCHLQSTKGSRYAAGVIKVPHFGDQMIGQIQQVQVERCLDEQAYCRLKVLYAGLQQVHADKIDLPITTLLTNGSRVESERKGDNGGKSYFGGVVNNRSYNNSTGQTLLSMNSSPRPRFIHQQPLPSPKLQHQNSNTNNNHLTWQSEPNNGESKSQLHFYNSADNRQIKPAQSRLQHGAFWQLENDHRLMSPRRIDNISHITPSNTGNHNGLSNQSVATKNHMAMSGITNTFANLNQVDSGSDFDKLMEAQAYKDSYIRLKDKYKRQVEAFRAELEKRMKLEKNQNVLKIDIMRYKLRVEELQRQSNDSSQLINELKQQLGQLKSKEKDSQRVHNELIAKETYLKNQQDQYAALQHDLAEQKDLVHRIKAEHAGMVTELELELTQSHQQLKSKAQTHQNQMTFLNMTITHREQELLKCNAQRAKLLQTCRISQEKIYELMKQFGSQTQHLKGEIDGGQVRETELKREVGRLEAELTRITASLDQKNKLQQVQKLDKSEQEKIISSQNNLIHQLKNDFETQKALLSVSSRQNTRLKEQIDRLMEEHTKKCSQWQSQHQNLINNYKFDRQSFSDQKSRLQQTVSQLSTQVEHYKQQISSKKHDISQLKTTVIEMERVLSQKNQKGSQLEETKSQLQQRIISMEATLKEQTAKHGQVATEMKQHSQQQAKHIDTLKEELNTLKYDNMQVSLQNELTRQLIEKEQQYKLEMMTKQFYDNLRQKEAEEKSLNDKLGRMELSCERLSKELDETKKSLAIADKKLLDAVERQKRLEASASDLQVKTSRKQATLEELEAQLKQKEKAFSETKLLLLEKGSTLQQTQTVLAMKSNHLLELQTEMSIRQTLIESLRQQGRQQSLILQRQRADRDSKFKQQQVVVQNLWQIMRANVWIEGEEFGTDEGSRQDSQNDKQAHSQVRREGSYLTDMSGLISSLLFMQNRIKKHLGVKKGQLEAIQRQLETVRNALEASKGVEKQLRRKIEAMQSHQQSLSKSASQIEKDWHLAQQAITHKDKKIEQLSQQCDEHLFTLSSLKMQGSAQQQEHSRQLRAEKESNRNLNEQLQNAQTVIGELQAQIEEMNDEIMQEKQQFQQQKKNLSERIYTLEGALEDIRRRAQDIQTEFEQKKFENTVEVDRHRKTQEMLESEEKKNKELQAMISGLMKEKEEIIGVEFTKNMQEIASLKAKLSDTDKHLEIAKAQLEVQRKKALETAQQTFKHISQLNQTHKTLEQSLNDKNNLILHLNSEVESQTQDLRVCEQVRQRLQSSLEAAQVEIKSLREELNVYINLANENERVKGEFMNHQSESAKISLELASLKQLSRAIEQRNGQLLQLVHNLETNYSDLQADKEQLETSLSNAESAMKDQEENMNRLNGKLATYEAKLLDTIQENQERLEETIEDWKQRYEAACEQYDQKIQVAQQETQYYQQLLRAKESESTKQQKDAKSYQRDMEAKMKSVQKLNNQMEADRVVSNTLHAVELQKQQQKCQQLQLNIQELMQNRERDVKELRTLHNALEQMKAQNRQLTEQVVTSEKSYSQIIQSCRKRDQSYFLVQEALKNQTILLQTEVRKVFLGMNNQPFQAKAALKKAEDAIIALVVEKVVQVM